MTLVFNVLLIAVTIGTTWFPIRYHFGTGGDWRRSAVGRHLMGYTAAAALLSWSGIVRVFLPDFPLQEYIRIFAISLAVVFVWQRNFIFERAQRSADDNERTKV